MASVERSDGATDEERKIRLAELEKEREARNARKEAMAQRHMALEYAIRASDTEAPAPVVVAKAMVFESYLATGQPMAESRFRRIVEDTRRIIRAAE